MRGDETAGNVVSQSHLKVVIVLAGPLALGELLAQQRGHCLGRSQFSYLLAVRFLEKVLYLSESQDTSTL